MNQENWIELEKKYHLQIYGRLPVVLVEGKGMEVYDIDGKRYLDFLAGIGVNNVGHCHPKVVEAIKNSGIKLEDGDFVVLSEKMVSTAEGNFVEESKFKPGILAYLCYYWSKYVWGYVLGKLLKVKEDKIKKDKEDKIIYIGKAKSLKKRVRNYFTDRSSSKTRKIINLSSKISYSI